MHSFVCKHCFLLSCRPVLLGMGPVLDCLHLPLVLTAAVPSNSKGQEAPSSRQHSGFVHLLQLPGHTQAADLANSQAGAWAVWCDLGLPPPTGMPGHTQRRVLVRCSAYGMAIEQPMILHHRHTNCNGINACLMFFYCTSSDACCHVCCPYSELTCGLQHSSASPASGSAADAQAAR
jgi:hypothetical protein